MRSILIFILCFCFSCAWLSAAGTSEAFLKQVPLSTLIHLYETHPDAAKKPQLKEFAQFFRDHQDLFQQIVQREEANADQYYILYRGANGQRLVFDTIRALHPQVAEQVAPSDFVFFRDPEDEDVRTDHLLDTVLDRWPPLPPEQKQVVLNAVFNRQNVPIEDSELLWNVLWGDLDPARDLTSQQKQVIARELGEQTLLYRRYLHALLSDKWREWSFTDDQKKSVLAIYRRLETQGHGSLIGWLRDFDYAYDYAPDFRPRNIAVNISLFSGCAHYTQKGVLYPSEDECTPLYWFAPDLGYHQHEKSEELRKELLIPILKRHGIPSTELQELEKIYSSLQPVDDHLLFQIMIPKRLEEREGRKQPLLDTLFYLSHKIGRPAYYLGRVRPSEILESYRRDPQKIPGFIQLQGRLLFTTGGLLDPKSGIQVVTYYLPGASQQRIEGYQKRLQQWAKRVSLTQLAEPLRNSVCSSHSSID